MKVITLHTEGIPNIQSKTHHFNDDINIVTGKNGSGKTTLIKLIWYIASGNLEHLLKEITFDHITLTTDVYEFSISQQQNAKSRRLTLELKVNNERKMHDTLEIEYYPLSLDKVNRYNVLLARNYSRTVFFPTFRRIEGGFSLGEGKRENQRPTRSSVRWHDESDDLQRSLLKLSNQLSNFEHKFVTSISTDDLVDLVMLKFAEVSEKINKEYRNLSENIINDVNKYQTLGDHPDETLALKSAAHALKSIQSNVQNTLITRDKLYNPFLVLSDLIRNLFKDKGISLTDSYILGDEEHKIDSSKLSAGEKQLLSFLCYNTFFTDGIIFIDEPELSLHVDWQRMLISTLISQNNNNQFIIATHSPFIYSKYEDKEISLSMDKGL